MHNWFVILAAWLIVALALTLVWAAANHIATLWTGRDTTRMPRCDCGRYPTDPDFVLMDARGRHTETWCG